MRGVAEGSVSEADVSRAKWDHRVTFDDTDVRGGVVLELPCWRVLTSLLCAGPRWKQSTWCQLRALTSCWRRSVLRLWPPARTSPPMLSSRLWMPSPMTMWSRWGPSVQYTTNSVNVDALYIQSGKTSNWNNPAHSHLFLRPQPKTHECTLPDFTHCPVDL